MQYLELKTYANLVKVSGDDAVSFMQSVFSNDVSKLEANSAQYQALFTANGELVANLWLMNYEQNYYFIVNNNLVEFFLKRLKMFVLRSKVLFEVLEAENLYLIFSDKVIDIDSLKLLPNLGLMNHKPATDISPASMQEYKIFCIKNRIPNLDEKSAGKYSGAFLNLEAAISYQKGCFPGQELLSKFYRRHQVAKTTLAIKINKAVKWQETEKVKVLLEDESVIGMEIINIITYQQVTCALILTSIKNAAKIKNSKVNSKEFGEISEI